MSENEKERGQIKIKRENEKIDREKLDIASPREKTGRLAGTLGRWCY
jgi:hypothetical protein